jgi:hypothetical protein
MRTGISGELTPSTAARRAILINQAGGGPYPPTPDAGASSTAPKPARPGADAGTPVHSGARRIITRETDQSQTLGGAGGYVERERLTVFCIPVGPRQDLQHIATRQLELSRRAAALPGSPEIDTVGRLPDLPPLIAGIHGSNLQRRHRCHGDRPRTRAGQLFIPNAGSVRHWRRAGYQGRYELPLTFRSFSTRAARRSMDAARRSLVVARARL